MGNNIKKKMYKKTYIKKKQTMTFNSEYHNIKIDGI